MVQSGLPGQWRDCGLELYCYLRNVQDKMTDAKTAYEKTCSVKFDGLLIRAKVSHKTISSSDEARLHCIDLVKICFPKSSWDMCYVRGGRWSGDLLIEDGEDFENQPASDIHVKRFKPEVAQEGKLFSICRRTSQTLRCASTSTRRNACQEKPRAR